MGPLTFTPTKAERLPSKRREVNYKIQKIGSKRQLTPDVEAGAGQDVSLVVVADQVVARRLPGGVESGQRHAEVGRAQHSVQGAGQLLAVQRPEQRAGVDAQIGVDPAAGRQVGPHGQDGVLGVDYGDIWRRAGPDFRPGVVRLKDVKQTPLREDA